MSEHEHQEHWGHHGRDPQRWWKERSILAKIGLVIGGLVLAVGGFVLVGMGIVWLWNWLMPVIFNLPTINFWQAWGLMLLSSILFKSPGGGGHGSSRRKKRQMRDRMAQAQQDIKAEAPGGPATV